jgi:hypothetical protein
MTAKAPKTWQVGSTTASLLVASLLVLQGLVIGFASIRGEAGLSANSICVTKDGARSGDPSAPAPRHAHGDQCCVFHCSGGVPAASSWQEALVRVSHARDAWSGDEASAFSPWPTLPVGSRAPPISIL